MASDEVLWRSKDPGELRGLFERAHALVKSARGYIGQLANTVTVLTSFELGRYIVEQEQQGRDRADYGAHVLDALSAYLTQEFGRGFSRANVANMRQFYLAYRNRAGQIVQSSIRQLGELDASGIVQSQVRQSGDMLDSCPFKLSWTHYQTLMRIEDRAERDFYEREAIRNAWNVKTLRRQYGSSLYERLALSRDKDGVMRLANEGAVPQEPADMLKTPFVLEFAGLEEGVGRQLHRRFELLAGGEAGFLEEGYRFGQFPYVGALDLADIGRAPRFHGVVDLGDEALTGGRLSVFEALPDCRLDDGPFVVDAQGAAPDVPLSFGVFVGYAPARHLGFDAVIAFQDRRERFEAGCP